MGDPETKGVAAWLVIGSLVFSAFNLWTLELFHDHWEQVHARLIGMGQRELVQWVNEYVLFLEFQGGQIGRPLAERSHAR